MHKKIDILIPCFNEAENIPYIVDELDKYIKNLEYDYGFIFIDDGSTDDTYESIVNLSSTRNDINFIKLSRNFGKEAAIAVGLKYCNSDAAIIIDSDLQHPPHLIPGMIVEWEKGAEVVDGVKITRQKENVVKKIMGLGFNKLIGILTGMDFGGSSDYKLVDKKVISILNSMDEKNRFFRGLTNWVGFRHSKIEFKVEERKSGKTKWNLFGLFRLSIDSITSYSSKPLHIVTVLGILTLLFSIILGLQTLYNKFFGSAVSGFTTVILVILLLCSVLMISIGILGIYLSNIYNEVKNRPTYVVDSLKVCNKNKEVDI
jgi:polyisoprenyl-phosphate glycosyltransferase